MPNNTHAEDSAKESADEVRKLEAKHRRECIAWLSERLTTAEKLHKRNENPLIEAEITALQEFLQNRLKELL